MIERLEFDAIPFNDADCHLQQLWQKTFGDSKEFIQAFFDIFDARHHVHTLSLDGNIVSVLYALPFTLLYNGKKEQVAYIYAVATDELFRGKGFMQYLMKRVHNMLAADGFSATILLPAGEQLSNYYAKMGYQKCRWSDSCTPKGVPTPMFYRLNNDLPQTLNIHHFIS